MSNELLGAIIILFSQRRSKYMKYIGSYHASANSFVAFKEKDKLENFFATKIHIGSRNKKENSEDIKRIDSTTFSTLQVFLALFRLAVGSRSLFDFGQSPFTVAMVGTVISISGRHINMATLALSF